MIEFLFVAIFIIGVIHIPITIITPISPIAFFNIIPHPKTVSTASPSILPTIGIAELTTAFVVLALIPSTLLDSVPSKEITETKNTLDKAEDAAVIAHGAAMDAMVKASESAMLEVATAGTEMMIEAEALDPSNLKDVQGFAKTHNFYNEKTGEYSRSFVDALTNKGYDTSSMTVDKEWQITGTPINGGPTIYLPGTFSTKAEGEAALPEYLNEYGNSLKNLSVTAVIGSEVTGAYKKYATGGLVDYTGLAQVDGTPNKPEAFLSAEDTANIGAAAKLLADLPIFNSTSNAENAASTNIGDTSIEIHINVENISDDYDVNQMIERVKQDIVDVAKPIGTSVILNK